MYWTAQSSNTLFTSFPMWAKEHIDEYDKHIAEFPERY